MQIMIKILNDMLDVEKNTKAIMDEEIKKDDSLCDDTEYMNDYHNLEGFISGLEAAIGVLNEGVGV